MRILYLVLYAVIFWLLCWILGVTAVVQAVLWLFSNRASERIAQFGRGLGAYTAQVVEYLTFASEKLPFPMGDWPDLPTQLGPDDLRNL